MILNILFLSIIHYLPFYIPTLKSGLSKFIFSLESNIGDGSTHIYINNILFKFLILEYKN